ncbi:hypothetical protein KP509_23G014900 [Ceratopteris richardii]|uniref:Protein kinase domain-containing protein n=1 Tax=Ceratopteris richardii TaxID=49495 RepID=A0A8T2S019_CERRI|nr:hypothetical protein KP509_23G014900 [Ceratopteris richardii]KAH7301166.1 hypothetical protein KP509_23G014900 [Ceratopteris richardii]
MADSKFNDDPSANERGLDDGLERQAEDLFPAQIISINVSGEGKGLDNTIFVDTSNSTHRDLDHNAFCHMDFQERQFADDLAAAAIALKKEKYFPLSNSVFVDGNIHPRATRGAANCPFENRLGKGGNTYSLTSRSRVMETGSNSGSAEKGVSTSLRVWLDNSERMIDKIECLHIFKQIAEFVDLAHSQGVVMRNVRPSSFLVSSTSRISIIESASSNSSSSSSAESTSRGSSPNLVTLEQAGHSKLAGEDRSSTPSNNLRFDVQENSGTSPSCMDIHTAGIQFGDRIMERPRSGKGKHIVDSEGGTSHTSSSSEHADAHIYSKKFPLKDLLSLEMMWYKSPEEIAGETPDFPADMYSLGVLLVELFYSSRSQGEWSRAMSDLRHRLLPPSFLLEFPKEAAYSLLLLHPNPNSRPKAREILHADIFGEIEDKIAEREAIMYLEEKMSEAEVTLEFLLEMQQRKHILRQNSMRELQSVNNDIEELKRWQSSLMKNRWDVSFKYKSMKFVEGSSPETGGSKLENDRVLADESLQASCQIQGGLHGMRQELILAKSAQLMKYFTELREYYFLLIKRDQKPSSSSGPEAHKYSKPKNDQLQKYGATKLFNASRNNKVEQRGGSRLGCFYDDFCHFMKYSKFNVRTTLRYGDILNTKNMVCSLNFDCDDEYFATAGVSRKIKVFDCNALLEEFGDVHYPVIEMSSRMRLSCVSWNRFQKSLLSSSDFDGAIQVWDVSTGKTVSAFKEHSRCAWSVDFSHFEPTKLASGSDDCSVKLWNINQSTSIGTIRIKANVCSVQFSPIHSHILAFGSADSQVYFHDLRYARIPMFILTGHQKAVSFIRFFGPSSIVSSSTDNTVRLWELTQNNTIVGRYSASTGLKGDCIRTYSGHTNLKNFVGLSVAEDGYIACGSESNEVFVYHKSLPVPMLSHKFRSIDPISGKEMEDLGDQFVSSVCWRNRSQILVIANSIGNVQILEME